MGAKGIKGSPPFPAPAVPGVSGDLNFFMSTWATQEYSKTVSEATQAQKDDPDYIPSSIYSDTDYTDRDLWEDVNVKRKKKRKE